MGKTKIIITFNQDSTEGDSLSFYRMKKATLESFQMKSEFVEARAKKFDLPIYPPTSTPGEAAAIAYEQYFNMDFNSSGLMSLVRGLNTITIEIDDDWTFNDFTSIGDGGIEVMIMESTPGTFRLLSATLEESSTPCETVLVKIVTIPKSDSYRIALAGRAPRFDPPTPVTGSPFWVEIPRTTAIDIVLYKDGSDSINVSQKQWDEPHVYIQKPTMRAFDIFVFGNPLLGSSAVGYMYYPGQLSQRPQPDLLLEYSLNGVDWQESQVFDGLTDGDYTMRIRDSLGCVLKKDFIVDGVRGSREKYVFISDLNSVGFAESEIWDGAQGSVEKNSENTLAESERYRLGTYNERLIFREDDEVRIQFKSNYKYNFATLERCDRDSSYEPIVEKMSKNLDQFEWLDAKMYSYGDGSRTAIYYESGQVYNKFGENITDYELNGNLPSMAIIGNTIEIIPEPGFGIGGIFEVADILYDSSIGKNVMIFNYDCNSVFPVDVTTKSYYDLLPYEIYEFTVPFHEFAKNIANAADWSRNQVGRIRIRATDDQYDERNFYSNWFEIIRRKREYDLEKYFAINYSSNNNRSIFYLYGITHFFRAEVDFSHTIIDDNVESVKGDSGTYLSESTVHQGISIKFADCTHKVMMKIILALSSENVFINGLGYVKQGNVESEPVEGTNLYSLTCTMLRNSQNFNAFISGRTGKPENYKNLYIPALITTNLGGSIKI